MICAASVQKCEWLKHLCTRPTPLCVQNHSAASPSLRCRPVSGKSSYLNLSTSSSSPRQYPTVAVWSSTCPSSWGLHCATWIFDSYMCIHSKCSFLQRCHQYCQQLPVFIKASEAAFILYSSCFQVYLYGSGKKKRSAKKFTRFAKNLTRSAKKLIYQSVHTLIQWILLQMTFHYNWSQSIWCSSVIDLLVWLAPV